jgi:hypothetical protein
LPPRSQPSRQAEKVPAAVISATAGAAASAKQFTFLKSLLKSKEDMEASRGRRATSKAASPAPRTRRESVTLLNTDRVRRVSVASPENIMSPRGTHTRRSSVTLINSTRTRRLSNFGSSGDPDPIVFEPLTSGDEGATPKRRRRSSVLPGVEAFHHERSKSHTFSPEDIAGDLMEEVYEQESEHRWRKERGESTEAIERATAFFATYSLPKRQCPWPPPCPARQPPHADPADNDFPPDSHAEVVTWFSPPSTRAQPPSAPPSPVFGPAAVIASPAPTQDAEYAEF